MKKNIDIQNNRKIKSLKIFVTLYLKLLKNVEIPIINRILYKFDPIILPITRFGLFFFIAAYPAAISGNDVPIAITVKPITDSEIPKSSDILIALKTVISAPIIVTTNEKKITGTPNKIGDPKILLFIAKLGTR